MYANSMSSYVHNDAAACQRIKVAAGSLFQPILSFDQKHPRVSIYFLCISITVQAEKSRLTREIFAKCHAVKSVHYSDDKGAPYLALVT